MTEEQFRACIDIRGIDECWVWIGRTTDDGYGTLCWKGNDHVRAHRLAWELANGPILEGLWVLHHCDNPPCCNPRHLFLGTAKDNRQDDMRKGRILNLEQRRKISEEQKGNKIWLGRHHTEEANQKNREAHLGNTYGLGWCPTEEQRRKMSEARKHWWDDRNAIDRQPSEETRRKLSEAAKRDWAKRKATLDKH